MKRVIASMAAFVLAFSALAQAADKDIVDTAVAAGKFNTLAKALQATELVDALKGDGPFTVFAPTDEAFSKLPEGALQELISKPEELKKILLYHVVAGKVTSQQVTGISEAETLSGKSIKVKVRDGKVYINDAQVIQADVMTSNGVIHVIDTVLLPQ